MPRSGISKAAFAFKFSPLPLSIVDPDLTVALGRTKESTVINVESPAGIVLGPSFNATASIWDRFQSLLCQLNANCSGDRDVIWHR